LRPGNKIDDFFEYKKVLFLFICNLKKNLFLIRVCYSSYVLQVKVPGLFFELPRFPVKVRLSDVNVNAFLPFSYSFEDIFYPRQYSGS